jgi:WD40 repeat protein
MSEQPDSNLRNLDIDLALRVDAICRQFEADWQNGRQVDIAVYLSQVPELGRTALRAELEAVLHELRMSDGTQTDLATRTRQRRSKAAEQQTIGTERPAKQPTRSDESTAIHAEATLPPRNDATVPIERSPARAPRRESPARVRYFGDYEIGREIARGGMGVVFEARQVSLNRKVALKMILAGQLANDADVKRFHTEAEAAANLDHPGIVPIYEVGQHEGQHYFSMGFVDGENLSQKLKAGPLDARPAAMLMIAVADAIEYAHQYGVIHRDLKPSNILLDAKGRPRVTDFGIAKRTQSESGLTGSGQIMGTPSYMPPEQAGGRPAAVGPASDVYSLGATLYCVISGRPPFEAASPMDTVIQVLSEEPVPPRQHNPSIPRDLETICLKCLEKEPGDRYPSAAAFAADLRRFLTGEPITARPVTRIERLAKWARRKPTLAAAYTLGFLALSLGGVGSAAFWQWRAAERARSGEMVARTSAELARDAAKSAQAEAERQRDRADAARAAEQMARAEVERQREKLERFEYGRTIEVAHQEWRDNNVAAALSLLDGTRADLRGWEWRYVSRLCHSELFTIAGGLSSGASFSPEGSLIVTVDVANHNAKVWDALRGLEILTLKGHTDRISSASFSPDSLRILTSSEDKTAKIWDANTGALLLTLSGHAAGLWSATYSLDGSRVATASRDKTARIWDAKTGNQLGTLKGHTGQVLMVSFSLDGSRIVTGADDTTAKVWDVNSSALVHTLKARDFVQGESLGACPVFSPDGTRIVTWIWAGGAEPKLWDAKTGALLAGLGGHAGRAQSASFSPDGSRVLTACFDGTAKIWDSNNGTLVRVLRGHSGLVSSASVSPDGSRVVTSSSDKTAKLWDVQSGAEILTLRGHNGNVQRASFSPDGGRVLTCGETAKVWNAKKGPGGLALKGHANVVMSASFSPDGSRIVTGSQDSTAKIWDARSGAEMLTISNPGFVMSASFSPDGSRIVTGVTTPTPRIWDAKNGAETVALKGHTSAVWWTSFSADGLRVLTGSLDKTAKVWDAKRGFVVLTFWGHTDGVICGSFSPDGSRIVTGSNDRTAKIWNAQSGALLSTITAHKGPVRSVSFSPDGHRFATASEDWTVKVWDTKTVEEILTLRGHLGGVNSVSFNRDGSRILTSSFGDRTLKLWDAQSGAEVFTRTSQMPGPYSASFSPDGARIVTSSSDGTPTVWDAAPINNARVVTKR